MAYADYIYYATVYMGGSLTEDIFPALAVKASAYIDYVTMGRAKNAFGDAADAVKNAVCALAEIIQDSNKLNAVSTDTERAVSSETVGAWTRSFDSKNVRQSGHEFADAATLYIPFAVEAVDGKTGAAKAYAKPQEFVKAADRSGLWTLSYNGNGGETVFVKGEFISENMPVVQYHDDCYKVTKVDAMDYGSPDMQHWEVGGA